jgi:thiol-disulfide isomerase/thioredoxin
MMTLPGTIISCPNCGAKNRVRPSQAPWCGPCRIVSPVVERIGREDVGRLKVIKLNVDDDPVLQSAIRSAASRSWSWSATTPRSTGWSSLTLVNHDRAGSANRTVLA